MVGRVSPVSAAREILRVTSMSCRSERRDNYFPRFLSWRRTSRQELEDTDTKILDALPCVKERKFVPVGEDRLWSVTCNPDNTGTPILMVHGMGGGLGLWTMNLDALSKNRPVYAFDLLGFGRSSHPSFSSDADEAEAKFVDSIETYRKEMNLDKFILLGHSLGGFLCASYCLRYPEHVKHLIMVDPWGMDTRPSEGTRRELPLLFKFLLPLFYAFNPLSMLRAIGPLGPVIVKKFRPGLAETFAEKLGDPSIFHEYIYHCNAQSPSGEIGFKSLTKHMGWAKQPMLERMTAIDPDLPISFIYGAQSWVDRNSGWKVKQARQSYVDVQILRGAGHHVYADRYNVFNSLVESIASSVDMGELPDLDRRLVKRIHAAPSTANFNSVVSEESDFQRPMGYPDENEESEMKAESDSGEGDGENLQEKEKRKSSVSL
ncbi:(Lyso)-N-acylphosphatidylethanolamine lipase-like isoform X2 [Littorina saxatilis]|uniref:AB hydrolase-1 domain-containing protein n=1 Tax=Littorina saxatilis TaxID=31220 RepID=A0AAN9BZQ7_9CAEN